MTIEHLSFKSSQTAALNHLGIVITFGFDGVILTVRVSSGSFVTTQQLVTLVGAKLLNSDLVALRSSDKQVWAETALNHVRATSVGKLEPNMMERAFWKFQITTRAVKQVLPELSIMRHEVQQMLNGRLRVTEEVVGPVAGVINEAQHVKSDLKSPRTQCW